MLNFKKIIDTTIIITIYILAFLLPLAFTRFTTEYFDSAKLILLSIGSLLLLLLWALKIYLGGKITLIKTPLDFLFLLFLVVALISTVLSPTPYPALFGLIPKVHGSLIFIVALVLFYFMITSNVKNEKQTQNILYLMVISAVILATISLLSYFRIFLPFKAAQVTYFSLAGSPAATAIYVTMLLPLSVGMGLKTKKLFELKLPEGLAILATAIFLVTIILIGNLSIWIGAGVAIALTLYFCRPSKEMLLALAIIGVIVAVVAVLAYTPTLKNETALGKLSSSFQKEVQLPFVISWKASAGAFRDSPILGTGPGTYLYDFTQYKPVEINKSDLWDKRVGQAHNQYLQTLAEMGGTGALILILISITFIFIVLRNIRGQEPVTAGLGLAGITFAILMVLSPMTVLTQSLGVMLFALFLNSLKDRHSQIREMEVNLASGYGSVPPLVTSLMLIPVLCLIVAGAYFLGKLSLGEYYHRKAIDALASNKGLEGYNNLVAAESKNPQIDLYRVDLAQTNFALANAIATQKGPSEASPGGSLTDSDRKNIQQLIQQAIAEGRAGVALAPKSAANWEVLANIYRQISGVAQNATQFSLDAYGRAIQLDPLNPLLRLAVGGVYYQAKNYDLAVRFFDDAVSLKPDYSNALYNLAIALREKGNIQDAIKVAEKLVASLQDKPDSKDYKLASELLSQLKEKAQTATESAKLQNPEPASALEKENLPKVINLPKPEKVSTPPAVQK